jgi:hypothetical protein
MTNDKNGDEIELLLGAPLPHLPADDDQKLARLVDAGTAFAGLLPGDVDELRRALTQAGSQATPFVACAVAMGLKGRAATEAFYTGYLSQFFASHVLATSGLDRVCDAYRLTVVSAILIQLILAEPADDPVAQRVLSQLPRRVDGRASEAQLWLAAHLLFEPIDFVSGGRAWPVPASQLAEWQQRFVENIFYRTSADRAAAEAFHRFMWDFFFTLRAFVLFSPIGLLVWRADGDLLDEIIDLVASYSFAIARTADSALVDRVIASAKRQPNHPGYVVFVHNLALACHKHALELPEPDRVRLIELAYSRIATLETESFEISLFPPIERSLGLSMLRNPGLLPVIAALLPAAAAESDTGPHFLAIARQLAEVSNETAKTTYLSEVGDDAHMREALPTIADEN